MEALHVAESHDPPYAWNSLAAHRGVFHEQKMTGFEKRDHFLNARYGLDRDSLFPVTLIQTPGIKNDFCNLEYAFPEDFEKVTGDLAGPISPLFITEFGWIRVCLEEGIKPQFTDGVFNEYIVHRIVFLEFPFSQPVHDLPVIAIQFVGGSFHPHHVPDDNQASIGNISIEIPAYQKIIVGKSKKCERSVSQNDVVPVCQVIKRGSPVSDNDFDTGPVFRGHFFHGGDIGRKPVHDCNPERVFLENHVDKFGCASQYENPRLFNGFQFFLEQEDVFLSRAYGTAPHGPVSDDCITCRWVVKFHGWRWLRCQKFEIFSVSRVLNTPLKDRSPKSDHSLNETKIGRQLLYIFQARK